MGPHHESDKVNEFESNYKIVKTVNKLIHNPLFDSISLTFTLAFHSAVFFLHFRFCLVSYFLHSFHTSFFILFVPYLPLSYTLGFALCGNRHCRASMLICCVPVIRFTNMMAERRVPHRCLYEKLGPGGNSGGHIYIEDLAVLLKSLA